MDKIFICGLQVDCVIGVEEKERASPQSLLIDLELATAFAKPIETDAIADAVDYEKVCLRVREIAAHTRFHLLESLGDRIAKTLLEEYLVETIELKIRKPQILEYAKEVGIQMKRRRNAPL